MQAIEAPVLKTTMVAALALGAFAIPMRAAHHESGHVQQHMLVLHAPVLEHAIYLTAWSAGDFMYPLDVDHLQPLHFKMKAYISDGCHWLGEETLVPDGERRFAYTYEETILSCEPGSTPAIKTPRTGYVTIDQ